MILKRILTTFDNLNLKRCKIDSEIEYGSQKGEIMVYKKRQRASVDQPCSREPGVLTSSSSSLTSREESQQVCSDQSKSSRGRVRAVPSRFRDSIVGTWKSLKSRKEESTETCIWGSSKLHRSKDPKLFPRKDNEDSSEVDCDYWDANFGMPKKSDASRKGVYKPEEFTVGDLVWAGCDWMPIGAFVLDSRTSLLTESLSGRLKVPKEGTIERMLQKYLQLVRPVCDLRTMQTLDARHIELFLSEGYKDGSWDYNLIGSHKLQKNASAACGAIFDLKHHKESSSSGILNLKSWTGQPDISQPKAVIAPHAVAVHTRLQENEVAEIQSVLWHLQESMAALQMMEIGFIVMSVMYGRMGVTIIYISALRNWSTTVTIALTVKSSMSLSILEEQNSVFKIECKCGSCGSRKQSPSEWERHTGCRY
ncbi:unnamed protein product [Arabidopsis thaliana]|uniref:Uncharacterized protein n=1 Tax=Arabidopsis thaliana TaxID=3702 RepID=A0A654FK35_ARATH|nr:unnamed protein product [Arabidopsis thaliana]